MTDAQRAAVIAELVRKLRAAGSWTGETHVQKTAYFLQELLGVPLELDFALYKYGPFSFELRDQLAEMRDLEQLQLEPQPYPYGPKFDVGPGADQLHTRFPKTIQRHGASIDFVAREVGPMGVEGLERIATALMVTKELSPGASIDDRAARLNEHKQHVGIEQAREAIQHVAQLEEQASEL